MRKGAKIPTPYNLRGRGLPGARPGGDPDVELSVGRAGFQDGALGKNVFGADRCRWVPLGAVRCLNREIVAAAIGTDRHHRDSRSGTDRHLRVQ